MNISLSAIGKRFNREWIFRKLDYEFESGLKYAILGNNGSGKSTLLQIISGSLMQSEGDIHYRHDNKVIPSDLIFRKLTIASPYLELLEEFTLSEVIDFHYKFKNYLSGFSKESIIEILDFEKVVNRKIKNFSSGMKQRVKLAFAILSDVPMVLLDEPCSNLDYQGMQWYQTLIENYTQNRLVLICSNHQSEEIDFCDYRLNILDYK